MTDNKTIEQHQHRLRRCRRCPAMHGPPVTGQPVVSPVMLIGQAPGNREIELHRPFAWTAGKTLFGWFARIGLEEEHFRQRVYMAAVCRCFPGKLDKGGDRVPDKEEIANCRSWWQQEVDLLQPQLLIPVGKLAISQFMPVNKLNEVIGQRHRIEVEGKTRDLIPLPHPSGASTWHRTEPGKTLLNKALQAIKRHPAWKKISAEC
ncbi:MAG: uracil-DNA glycosylase family protein [Pseudomonadota bacterium]|nr:uracil-DNA glycosylase family protein [Pseudomonadota bacterium]